MKRTASEVLRSLETRIARLEKSALISRVEAMVINYSKKVDQRMDSDYTDKEKWGYLSALGLAEEYAMGVRMYHLNTPSLRPYVEPEETAPYKTLTQLAEVVNRRGYSKALKDSYVKKALTQIKELGL